MLTVFHCDFSTHYYGGITIIFMFEGLRVQNDAVLLHNSRRAIYNVVEAAIGWQILSMEIAMKAFTLVQTNVVNGCSNYDDRDSYLRGGELPARDTKHSELGWCLQFSFYVYVPKH